MGKKEGKFVFSRTSSGLRREWSIFDAFIFNGAYMNPLVHGFLALSLIPAFWGGADLIMVTILGVIVFVPVMWCYAWMGSSMPRAGGDYVYVSRILAPSVGFMTVITLTITLVGWAAADALKEATYFLQPLFSLTGNSGLAEWVMSFNGLVTVGVIFIIVSLTIVGMGMKWWSRILKWSGFWTYAGIIIVLVLLGVSSHTDFVNAFNNFMSPTVGINAYQQVIDTSRSAGLSFAGYNWPDTLVAFLFMGSAAYAWCSVSTAHLSEIKGVDKVWRNTFSSVGAVLVGSGIMLLFYYLFPRVVGWEFWTGLNYLYFTGQGGSLSPAMPYFPYFVSLLGGGLFVVLLFVFWMCSVSGDLVVITMDIGNTVKYWFASAFDGILPRRLADVNQRTGAPIKALILFGAAFLAWSVIGWLNPLYAIGTIFVANGVVILISNLATTVSSIAFPYRKKEVYEASPIARYKVAGIPVISIVGVIGTITSLLFLYWFATTPVMGVTLESSIIALSVYAIAGVIYVISRVMRKRQGIDLSLAFKELPPA